MVEYPSPELIREAKQITKLTSNGYTHAFVGYVKDKLDTIRGGTQLEAEKQGMYVIARVTYGTNHTGFFREGKIDFNVD